MFKEFYISQSSFLFNAILHLIFREKNQNMALKHHAFKLGSAGRQPVYVYSKEEEEGEAYF